MPPSPSSPFSRSITQARACAMARACGAAGNSGTTARSSASRCLKARPQTERYGPTIHCRTRSGGARNSSATPMPCGLRARGRNVISTSNGTMTVRDQ